MKHLKEQINNLENYTLHCFIVPVYICKSLNLKRGRDRVEVESRSRVIRPGSSCSGASPSSWGMKVGEGRRWSVQGTCRLQGGESAVVSKYGLLSVSS